MSNRVREDYVVDTPYTWGYYSDFAPGNLDYVAMMSGIAPVARSGRFRFLELGCGHGVSTNTFAACFPEATFDGVDLNPEHVAGAREIASAAGLANAHFHECTFADFLERPGEPYDLVALHGVYSWVGPDVRAQIRDIVARMLRPGGLAFVSYNGLPGWAPLLPLRRMMLAYSDALDTPSLERVRRGVEYLRYLVENDATFFAQNAPARDMVARMAGLDPRYLAHEYFHRHWNAFYFEDVAAELAECGLAFVGSAASAMNIDELSLPPKFRDLLRTAPNRTAYETHRGFVLNEMFRRDVYVKRPFERLVPDPLASWGEVIFGCLVAPARVRLEHAFPAGTVRYDDAIYRALVDLLAERSRTFAELVAAPALAGYEPAFVLNSLHCLCASGQFGMLRRHLHAAPPIDGAVRLRLASDLNRILLERRLLGDGEVFLAAPAWGAALGVDWLCGLHLLAEDRADAATPEAWAWAYVKRRDLGMHLDGQPIERDTQGMEVLRQRFAALRAEVVPLLLAFGVVAPRP